MVRSGLLLLGSLGLVVACAALSYSTPSTPAPAAGQRRTKTTSGSVFLDSDARQATSVATLKKPSACPPEMSLVQGACIDRYEAHLLLQQQSDGSLTLHPPHARPTQGKFVAAARAGVKPQAYISQIEAAGACSNAGKRLCSVVEWYGACTGSEKTTYPYGARLEAGRCNSGKPHLLSRLHGTNPLAWQYVHFNDPELAKQPGFLSLTGEYAGCAGPNGVYDLVGNLHEWVADRVDRALAKKLPVAAVIQRRIGRTIGNGIFMGGFFSTQNEHGPGCTYVTAAHERGYHDYSTGFRCCRDR